MEPRPHERGKDAVQAQDRPGARRFNGATSSRTWKARQRNHTVQRGLRLQWSHVLTNVERYFIQRNLGWIAQGFNGATSSRTWKVTVARPRGGCVMASMEPRPHERGKLP